MTAHACEFPEVVIEGSAADDNLRAGMKVLIPCTCGDTPFDHLELLIGEVAAAGAALAQVEPCRPLYHWAPTVRRKQITRYGLRPSMRSTTASCVTPVICLADTPSWAWALSGQQRNAPCGPWDLWQTSLDHLSDPVILPSDKRASGLHEIRTTHRIYKSNLWYVATRERHPERPR